MDLKNSMLLANMMSSKIPAIYKVLDWIQSKGTQYINTGIKLKNTSDIMLDCFYQAETTIAFFVGYYNSPISNSYMIGHNSASNTTNLQFTFGSQYKSLNFNDFSQRNIYEIKDDKAYINGTLTHTFNSEVFETTENVLLFAGKYGSNIVKAKMQIYSYKVWDSGVLIQNLIPVRRLTDNEVGMYDTVSKTFFGNAGTGSFVGSDE